MKKMSKLFVMIMFVVISFYSTSSMNVIGHTSNCVVKFDFDGLQAIAFGDSSRVSDGILNAHHHEPNMEIKQIENGKETVIGNLKSDELKGKVLNVDVASGKETTPTRHFSSDMNKDVTDFRWCLDIENDLFQKELYLKDNFLTKIHFNTGTFYAERLTEDKYQFVAGDAIHSFKRQIGRPAVDIELKQEDSLVISGLEKQITLPYKSGASYAISITNLPPADMANIEHFSFYYDAIKTNVPQFMPVLVKKASFRPAPIICEAIVFGKSTIK
jgi:hypothetical protein